MAKQKGSDLGDVKTRTQQDKVKISDLVELYKFPSNKYVTLRLHGPTFSYCTYWVKATTKEGKVIKFPVNSPSYDPATQDFDSTKYDPWKAFADKERADGVKNEDRKIQVGVKYYINAILRAEQRKEPAKRPRLTPDEKKSGFKDKASDSWTPNVALQLTSTVVDKIKKFAGINTVDGKSGTRSYPVSHPKFGCDIRIQYDADAKVATAAYDVQFVDKKTPMSEEEQGELVWDLSDLSPDTRTDADIKADFEGWAARNGVEISTKKKTSGKKKKEEEDDEDFDDDFGDDDEDEAPKKKKSTAKTKQGNPAGTKGKKRPSRDEEDEDEDEDDFGDDEDDEDEEDRPAKGKKKAPAKSSKRKSSDDEDEDDEDEDDFGDDEDEDDDFDDEDDSDEDEDEDEDDAPRTRSKKKTPAKKSAKRSSRDDDEDDDGDDDEDDEDDFDEDDEDDDDEPPKKSSKSKASAKKSVKSTKKSSRNDDDDDEDEDEDDFGDDDEDEDDEPVSKKKTPAKKTTKKAPAKKKAPVKGKKRPSRDEEDEDEDDFEDDDE